ncbi:fumarylacetoacetate hydrolase family protein [Corynebacterium sp. MSK078]|uniref:fumarylacetoacetate hydrolase family protein n=1 Tax=Corynebacterium sp. MSK078 TaxID=3050200 RepID=UPI00254F5F92|nr:fumarylacetoacetate hydrolase family protein [Corynebacterium sp. MSK078]MDK8473952.1 fumarylacetoacetate hydrolase family protein [Corynebacterium sp. MSK078]
MKLATLRTAFGTSAIRIEGDNVGVELDYEDVGALLRSEDWRKAAQLSGEPIVFDQHDLEAVVPAPGKIICVGLNYAKHIREMGRDFPEHPTLFIKFADALTGPFDDVYIPEYATQKLDYEGELAVVIGERTHRVTRADALDYVAGYAIMNDYTLRDFQRQTSQFHAGKSFYRTAGFGPWLTTPDEWAPGGNARLTTTVNGEVRQQDNTDDLIFSIAGLIEFCSQLYPLNPGDVIVTGTPEGVGFARDPQQFLQDGDTVAIDVEGLGHISNTTRYGEPGL